MKYNNMVFTYSIYEYIDSGSDKLKLVKVQLDNHDNSFKLRSDAIHYVGTNKEFCNGSYTILSNIKVTDVQNDVIEDNNDLDAE